MGIYFDFDDVDAFTAGAMGVPGQRTFFIQVRRMGERVTLKCEKQHTAALADFLRQLITQQPPPIDRPLGVAMELADVSDVAFDLGGISLGYDRDLGRVIVQFDEIVPVDEEGEEEEYTRGSTRELTEDLRDELSSLKPTRTVSSSDEDEDDDNEDDDEDEDDEEDD